MKLSQRPYIVRALYEWIVDCECTPFIQINALVDNVDVPPEYVSNDAIVLNIAPAACRDLEISNDYFSVNTRFHGQPYHIFAPIHAIMSIYARETGEGMNFDVVFEDLFDGASNFESEFDDMGDENHEAPPRPLRGNNVSRGASLHSVDRVGHSADDASGPDSDPSNAKGSGKKKSKKPSLKVIK